MLRDPLCYAQQISRLSEIRWSDSPRLADMCYYTLTRLSVASDVRKHRAQSLPKSQLGLKTGSDL